MWRKVGGTDISLLFSSPVSAGREGKQAAPAGKPHQQQGMAWSFDDT